MYRRGIQTRKNLFFRDRTFPFRDRREEGLMSNRAERLSDRAKRGSDSVARLDSPSDRRSRKGKVLSRKLSSSKFVLSSPGTHNCHQGGHIFLLCWSLSNHKSTHIYFSAFLKLLPFFHLYTFTRALLGESIIYSNQDRLDLQNDVQYVSELPLVTKWPAVKVGRTKKRPFYY